MGTYNQVYIGPYIKVKTVIKEVTYIKLVSPATDREFDITGDTKFCPVSGQQLLEKQFTRAERIYGQPDDVPEHFDDNAFWTPEYTSYNQGKVFLCNYNDDLLLSEDDLFIADLAGFNHDEVLKKFNTKYVKHIAHWKLLYGIENVSVCYGIVHYDH